MNNDETIAAISTKLGESAINIVRMSGKESLNIISNILGYDFSKNSPRTLYLSKIFSSNELIDECLITYFEENKSYNNELIVEINTHGGIIAAQKVLSLLLVNGARMAEPGEFTKRAFLNKKMSIEEVDAVSNIINSQTNLQHKVSINQYNGDFSKKIEDTKSYLMDIIAAVEVNIDYPEYDETEEITKNYLLSKISTLSKEIENISRRIKNGKILQSGINVSIIGKPNVGKSSILNALTNESTSIVTNIEGTTRDIVSEKIKINDIVLNVLDTAGIRSDASDIVEEIGIGKSINTIESSDVIFVVIDQSRKLDKNDEYILELVKDKNTIIIANKSDISIEENYNFDTINISAKNLLNIDLLEEEVVKKVFDGTISENEFYFLSSIEKQTYINNIHESIDTIKSSIREDNIFIDFLIIDLTNIYEQLSMINDTHKDGEILDRLFSSYCLGK